MDGECIRTSKSDRRNWKDPDEINKSKNVTCMISITLTSYKFIGYGQSNWHNDYLLWVIRWINKIEYIGNYNILLIIGS